MAWKEVSENLSSTGRIKEDSIQFYLVMPQCPFLRMEQDVSVIVTLLAFQRKFKINWEIYYLQQNIHNKFCKETIAKEANKHSQN